jgi:glycosyltransferase involved in cell wall biosynthesis
MSEERPRVLCLITRAVHGGAQSHVLDLMAGLADRFEFAIGVGEEGNLTDAAARLGVPVHVVRGLGNTISPWRDARAVSETVRLIRSLRPDLVVTHSSKAGLVGRAAAARCRVPSVFTAHGWSFAEGVPRARRLVAAPLERLAARWCRRVIVVCDADRRLALRRRIAPAEKLVTVRYGVRDVPERAAPGAAGVPVVAMVARFEPQKDHACLLRALALVAAPWRAVLVGDGPTRPAAEALARELGIADRVSFLGSRDDVAGILASAHVFALATRWEGLPITILEAMRAGLPVVASGVGGVGEGVSDGETGFLVPRGNANQFGRRIESLLADPALRERMGNAGRSAYEGGFTFEGMLDATFAVYEGVLAETRGTRHGSR